MGWEARALVGLEHTIGKSVLLSQLKVRSNIRWIHIHKLGIRGQAFGKLGVAVDVDLVSAIHRAHPGRLV